MTGLRLALLAPLVSLLCLAQTDAATNQKVLDELRSIRGSLERLERGQHALLSLLRLQGDRSHLEALDAQRLRLVSREGELSRQLADDKRVINAAPAQVRTADGGSEPAPRSDDALLRARVTDAEMALQEIRTRRSAVEDEIARLKTRIAAAEKRLAELLPD